MKTIKLNSGYEALVDDEYFEELNKYKWKVQKHNHVYYAVRSGYAELGRFANIYMHIAIMKTPKGMHTDHIDGNGLNNTIGNLRVVTVRQNTQNRHTKRTSLYPGVSWHKRDSVWRATISINKKTKHLGNFKNELDAYNAYLNALKELNEVCIKNLTGV
jgi:hypothetical protein